MRSTEERFRLTVEAATDYAIFVTDVEDRITDWLPGAAAVFGWSAEEAQGQSAAMLFTPEDRAAGVPEWEVETALRDGSAPDVRWHLCKDGSRVFIEGTRRSLNKIAGNGFLKIGQDVTEGRLTEERLRAGEERLRLLSELVPALLWQTDGNGDGVTFNARALDYLGRSAEQVQAGDWLAGVHPEDQGAAERVWGRPAGGNGTAPPRKAVATGSLLSTGQPLQAVLSRAARLVPGWSRDLRTRKVQRWTKEIRELHATPSWRHRTHAGRWRSAHRIFMHHCACRFSPLRMPNILGQVLDIKVAEPRWTTSRSTWPGLRRGAAMWTRVWPRSPPVSGSGLRL
nr:PAS domain S-box protein [Paracoccus sp. S-4012]